MERKFCTQCGAAMNNKNKCDFCGSSYQDSTSTSTKNTPRLKDADIGHVLKDLQPSKIMALPIIIFACLWCGGALSGGITMLSIGDGTASIMALIPIGMCLFGVVVFSIFVSSILSGGTKKILKLWQSERYDEAFKMCETKSGDNYKIAWALIAFHRYYRDDEANQKLLLASNNSLYSAASKSAAVSQLLQHFNIKVTAPPSNTGSSTNTTIHFGGGHHRH
ncbi:MAG: hypothetical protein LBN07_00885 [Christensenellaceae bacterium]|jgi:hypothetical protein|nr:hypothetical protein [Christensenellaceae bacterium]